MVGTPALIRRLGTVVSAAVVLLLGTTAPARAHGGLLLTVENDGRGAVSVDVAWADGHPVTASEPVAGTLVAVSSDGAQVGPAPLRRLTGSSTVVFEGALKPGAWQVTVDLATPGIGHCVADVVVAAAAEPGRAGSQRCGETEPPAAAPATPARGTGDGVNPVVLLLAAAAAIAVGTVAAIMWSRPARRRPRRR